MVVDATFDFERKRNRAVKYDRELVGTTLRAMKRVQEIKTKREERFYKARLASSKQIAKVQGRRKMWTTTSTKILDKNTSSILPQVDGVFVVEKEKEERNRHLSFR